MRRLEWLLVGGFVLAMVVVGFLGSRAGPDGALVDPRASTLLTGPGGASVLAEAIERLGVPVERRRIPLFGVPADLTTPDGRSTLLLIEPSFDMTPEERREIVAYAHAGGSIVLVGRTGVERALGVSIRRVVPEDRDKAVADTIAVDGPGDIGELPGAWSVLGRARLPDDEPPPKVVRTDTLLRAVDGRPVALRLGLEGGGRVLILAESEWVTNRAVRDTDVGALVVPMLLDLSPTRVVVDEYHHGFGQSGALFGAAWRWLRAGPPGWAMLQLAFAGLVALLASAFRFGPARHAIPRTRRSPLEHVDTLASGLERARGSRTAVSLLERGLERRLRRAGRAPRRGTGTVSDRAEWLATLTRATEDPAARDAITRLGTLLRGDGEGANQVLQTGQAVEDVWEALKRPSGRATS